MKCSRVLITGAYGLIGHETVHALEAAGFDVVPTDILHERPGDADFDALPLAVSGVDPILQFLREHRIEAVVHAGGVSGPMLGKSQPHAVLSTNAGGTLDLYEAARRASMRRIVLTSSSGAYGETGEAVVDETMPLGATDVYGVSKICSEQIAQAYAQHGVETVILRPSWVYGARRRTTCVIKSMIEDALANRPTRLPYGAGFPRQFVHVSDVASSVLAALTTSRGVQKAYNISDGTRYLLDDVAMLVRDRLPDAKIDLADGPDPDDVVCGRLDIVAAKTELDWEPKIDLPSGIDLMIAGLSGRT
ncbi:NAD-dependent epimerase/dehydratase family protein [Hoeflea sp.]|uniref:NAD-dependent epimerase/dehydratase family protein n=1 Tax=Hoeflea sp. TaxID=1940281 RepID=UPI003B52217A